MDNYLDGDRNSYNPLFIEFRFIPMDVDKVIPIKTTITEEKCMGIQN